MWLLLPESDQESCVGTPVKTPGIVELLGQEQASMRLQRRKGIFHCIEFCMPLRRRLGLNAFYFLISLSLNLQS